MKITGIADSASPFSSGSVSRLTLWICGASRASITTRNTIFAENRKRLNRSTSDVPTQTTPPPIRVKKITPVDGEISALNQSLTLEAISSPAPLM
ncbi:hypothetical protein D3C78_1746150 [compost metagenome]